MLTPPRVYGPDDRIIGTPLRCSSCHAELGEDFAQCDFPDMPFQGFCGLKCLAVWANYFVQWPERRPITMVEPRKRTRPL